MVERDITMEMDEGMPESSSETVETPSQESIPDYAQGYAITVSVLPSGYVVSGPDPLPQSADSDPELQDAGADAGYPVVFLEDDDE